MSWGREGKGVYFAAVPEEIRCIMAEIMWQWEYPHTGSRGGEQEVGPSYETSKTIPSDDDTVTPAGL